MLHLGPLHCSIGWLCPLSDGVLKAKLKACSPVGSSWPRTAVNIPRTLKCQCLHCSWHFMSFLFLLNILAAPGFTSRQNLLNNPNPLFFFYLYFSFLSTYMEVWPRIGSHNVVVGLSLTLWLFALLWPCHPAPK